MYFTFKDGECWLILDEKRLFRMPDSDENRSDEFASDYGQMTPEELGEFFQDQTPYSELHQHLKLLLVELNLMTTWVLRYDTVAVP